MPGGGRTEGIARPLFKKRLKLPAKVSVRLRAPAKINLTLRVLGRRADGYHDLHSWVAKLALSDGLTAQIGGDGFTLRVPTAPALEIEDNSVLVAARAFARVFGAPRGARFLLHKRTPIAAGLGGGSSDAAAALRALQRLTGRGTTAELARLAAEVGSDVPLFLLPGPVVLEGRGERVRQAARLPELWALLVKPALEIRAAEAYALFDAARRGRALTVDRASATSIDRGFDPAVRIEGPGAVGDMLANDLERGCVERYPALRRVLRGLGALSSLGFRMSGSGPTCFALFKSRAAAERARRKFAGSSHWSSGDWMAVSALRAGGGRLNG